jgi:hypothetical protein
MCGQGRKTRNSTAYVNKKTEDLGCCCIL